MSEQLGVPEARLWRRYVNLVLSNASGDRIELSDFRIQFEVRQFDNQSPNTADLLIYNPAEATAKRVEREFTRVALWAGYESRLGPIFEGTVKQFRRGRLSATDTYLNLRCADSDIAYISAIISTTLAAGSTAEDAVTAIMAVLEPLGVRRGYIAPLPQERSPRALVLHGNVRDVLRELAQSWGMSWSLQRGALTILPLIGPGPPRDTIVLNAATGMIGMPEQTIEGINVRSLLNPLIEVGTRLHIDNSSIQRYRADLSHLGEVRNTLIEQTRIAEDGFYRVLAVDHIGDTFSENWYSEITCMALDSTLPLGSAQRGRT